MANPFLVLGGIAVGIVTAAFGVLQVPGWVGSAQDAAAISDLSNVRVAQAASAAEKGHFASSLAALNSGDFGAEITLSGGVSLVGMAGDAAGWCASVQSASGNYFAASDRSSQISKGATADAAMGSAKCSPEHSQAASGATDDPAAGGSVTFTLNCTSEIGLDYSAVGLPLVGAVGTAKWSDGVEAKAVDGRVPSRSLPSDTDLTVTFEGTFTGMQTVYSDDYSSLEPTPEDFGWLCYRTIDSWTGNTGTTSMKAAFAGMRFLESVPQIPSGITDLSYAFFGTSSFNQPLTGWDTSDVTNMKGMFSGSSYNQPVRFDTSKVTDMSEMFAHTSFGSPLEIDTRNVTDMSGMFKFVRDFNQPVEFDTRNVTDMSDMFYQAQRFNQPVAFDTGNVTNMSRMFHSAIAFNQPVKFGTSKVTDMSGMFDDAWAFNQPVEFDTRSVTNMSVMFRGTHAFNQPVEFNTQSVTNMSNMFSFAWAFNQPVNFDTRNVTDMSSMFQGSHVFNQPLVNFDLSKVTDMSKMFAENRGFTYDISGWDVSNVTSWAGFNQFSFIPNEKIPAKFR